MTTDDVRIEQDYYAIRVKSGHRIVACAARNGWDRWQIAKRKAGRLYWRPDASGVKHPIRTWAVAWDVVDTKSEAYGLLARLVTGGVA